MILHWLKEHKTWTSFTNYKKTINSQKKTINYNYNKNKYYLMHCIEICEDISNNFTANDVMFCVKVCLFGEGAIAFCMWEGECIEFTRIFHFSFDEMNVDVRSIWPKTIQKSAKLDKWNKKKVYLLHSRDSLLVSTSWFLVNCWSFPPNIR